MTSTKTEITFDDFYKLDLRVAKIIWAGVVDGADRLLKLTLDVGEIGQRVVISPLGEHYLPAELLGKRVVYLANVKGKKIRGIMSYGVVLTACPFDEKLQTFSQVLVSPDKKVRLGSILK